MNKEQLDKIKQLYEMSEEYPEHKNVIDVELLREGVPALITEVERLQRFEQKAIYAIEENRKLREALEFYADKENWERTYQGSDIVAQGQLVDYWEPSPVEFDEKGNIARKALNGDDTCS